MNKFICMCPNYEILRYGHNKIKNQVEDAHRMGKLVKFIIHHTDLLDPSKLPEPSNYRFEPCQAETPDIVIYFNDKNRVTLKGSEFLE